MSPINLASSALTTKLLIKLEWSAISAVSFCLTACSSSTWMMIIWRHVSRQWSNTRESCIRITKPTQTETTNPIGLGQNHQLVVTKAAKVTMKKEFLFILFREKLPQFPGRLRVPEWYHLLNPCHLFWHSPRQNKKLRPARYVLIHSPHFTNLLCM